MTNLIDSYLLKSGMPADELCIIGRTKRAFYYYGVFAMAVLGFSLLTTGVINIVT